MSSTKLVLFAMMLVNHVSGLAMPSKTLSDARSKWLREAEKKHARIALLALPALSAITMANSGQDPVPWLNAQPAATQLIFYSVGGLFETLNLKRFDKSFTLKAGEQPGKLLPIDAVPPTLDLLEDGAGRLAMLATFAMLVNSVVT